MEYKTEQILNSLYKGEPQRGYDGQLHEIRSEVGIYRHQGEFLHDLFRKKKPRMSLEIGMAYGFSTVFILSAIRENGFGHHIAVDPYQKIAFHGIGLKKVDDMDMTSSFTFYEEMSCVTIPNLIAENRQFDIVFIDGDHRFDGALVDFYLSDKVCPINGLILFHDTWMPSLRKLISFIKNNFAYYKTLECPVNDIAIFEKIGNDERAWDHFIDFP